MKLKATVLLVMAILMLFIGLAGATQRMVLAELFTNTSWSGCYSADLVLDQLTENYPNHFACIRYHVWWPSENDPFYQYNPSESGIRTNYYGVNATPQLQVDGYIDAGYSGNQFWTYISNRYGAPSPLEIDLEGTFNFGSREGTLNITVTATDPISLDGLFLRIASVENDIYWPAPNGTDIHNQTFRNMFPYTLGQRIYIDTPGEVVEVSQDVNCPEPLDLDNCEFIVWVQSEQNKEILQTAKIPLTDFVPVGIDENADLPAGFELYQNYPNPFNAGTVIDYVIEKEIPVELSVYDLLGQKIATLVNEPQSPGHYQVNWDGMDDSGRAVASGMYFYKLSADGKSSSKRMTFLK